MRVADLHWMQVEAIAARDDRAVLPIGSTEQHAYLSLATDSTLAERVALEAAEPLGVPVFPVLPYGVTPALTAYPGTITLSTAAFTRVVAEILDGIHASGFRRVLIVNGHGGNMALHPMAEAWREKHPDARLKVHDWWKAPRVSDKVEAIDPIASHASWMENFPWTRLAGVAMPSERKPMTDLARLRTLSAAEAREMLGDGSFGGHYQRPDADMEALWAEAIAETRALLEDGWA
ncbi:MAG TPA: creatininase family protein [Candidatus Eisenbacteria bacterium]|nr:creatininase family protein [Candidatus Eisenbacteria bacterium]